VREAELRRQLGERDRELARLNREADRLAREAARAQRSRARVLMQLERQRGLWRLGPAARSAVLDGIRAEFVANGATPASALAMCAELDALANGHAAAVRAGKGNGR
jgi:hypothetical protein